MSIEGEIRRAIDNAMPGTNQHRGASELMHWYVILTTPEMCARAQEEVERFNMYTLSTIAWVTDIPTLLYGYVPFHHQTGYRYLWHTAFRQVVHVNELRVKIGDINNWIFTNAQLQSMPTIESDEYCDVKILIPNYLRVRCARTPDAKGEGGTTGDYMMADIDTYQEGAGNPWQGPWHTVSQYRPSSID